MSDPEQNVSPRFGLVMLSMPIAMAVLLVGGYVLVMVLGARGRPATGDRVTLDFAACAEAEPVVRARVEEMGLGDPEWSELPGGFRLVTTLPDWDGANEDIPATLARQADFQVRYGDEVLLTGVDIASATMRLDYTTSATTAVVLTEPATERLKAFAHSHEPGTALQVALDSEVLATLYVGPDQPLEHLELNPSTGDRARNIRAVAAWALLLNNGALPCPVAIGP